MRQIATLALLMGTLVVPSLYAEETSNDVPPAMAFPAPTVDAAPTVAAPEDIAPAPGDTVPDNTVSPDNPASQNDAEDTRATTSGPSVSDTPPTLPPVTNETVPATGGLAPTMVSGLNLSQMGMPEGIILSGGQLQGGANFTLPGDQVVTMAQLLLNVKVSPEMATRNATLQLMLNGQPLGTVPLGAAENDVSHFQLDVPAALMVSSNNLSFKINDGDAQQCLRDLNDKYRVVILPTSRFNWEGQQLDIGSDLSTFPRPFFDSMQMTPASVSVSFPARISADTVSAAAIVSSWLGMQADYRGIAFEALHDRLPDKHGIVIGHSGEQVGGLTLPQTSKPLLKIIPNPANPVYKLLLIVGNDEAALRVAAWRLTKGNFALQTASSDVDMQTIPVSQPYDAPRWIPTDHPVKISSLIRKDQSTTVSGVWHEPLRVAFRAAPDLYLWDGETIPLQIGYRFPSENWIDEQKSALSVTLNNTFLHNLPMTKQGILESLWHKLGGDARQERFTIPLEPYLIYGDNQMSLYFNVVPKESAPCSVLLNNNIKSRITDESWIDLSHTRHFSLLPNLSYFVGASFPFTRLADYSQTVLLLPEKPSEVQVTTMLNMTARSGNATGTALGNNKVIMGIPSGGANLEFLRSRDVLAVSGLDQKLFSQSLLANSPYRVIDNALGVRTATTWQKIQRWLLGDWSADGVEADRYLSSNSAWRGFVSYRSPWNSDRLVVVALGSNDDQLARLYDDLNSPRINAGIRGDTSIITNENGVRSFRVSTQFPSGQMPWYMMVVWYANQHSGLLAILGLIMTTILGLALTSMLRQHAHKRLNPGEDK
ncbi:cellulose biosynthesis cyclic di-GMP-binding regulatory protein BcsB [Scandinavium sp. H11S7]|uniref:Cyclic di-GMP-binding protein n=1 Tax=Scandinavium hiltneri TaxID=2926519 RepID=A0ABT2EAA5_9ENTR|nr:cellulose biosynthesis cyclic di-GMP-binding regulatory protein BcsB [Scandinavium hiltneri]MCS2163917.1 cellulose biosynthesis cyclic di-GMP-binding regulatory protein BcsB [Scandinavium hiltneri]